MRKRQEADVEKEVAAETPGNFNSAESGTKTDVYRKGKGRDPPGTISV